MGMVEFPQRTPKGQPRITCSFLLLKLRSGEPGLEIEDGRAVPAPQPICPCPGRCLKSGPPPQLQLLLNPNLKAIFRMMFEAFVFWKAFRGDEGKKAWMGPACSRQAS